MLALFSTMAVTLAAVGDANMAVSSNLANSLNARMAAESGVEFLAYTLPTLEAQGEGNALLASLSTELAAVLNGTANLNGATVQLVGGELQVPFVTVNDAGDGFSVVLTTTGGNTIDAVVTGTSNGARFRAGASFQASGSAEPEVTAFNYGIATAGSLELHGNDKVQYVNSPWEADIYVGSTCGNPVFSMNGNAKLEGDLYLQTPDAELDQHLNGNVSIGGERLPVFEDPEAPIWDHVHQNAAPVVFPRANPGDFEAYATNIVDSGTSTSGNKTFSNIRIKAGTNPHFNGNLNFLGVIYIEAPNHVTFSGNLNITAVIIAEDPGPGATDENYIDFSGNITVRSVASLDSSYGDLRGKVGTFLVAPGYDVRIQGNFGTISGAMAAEQFTWRGNVGGTIKGALINWGDNLMSLAGNASLKIDRTSGTGLPPGFGAPPGAVVLVIDWSTYREL